MMEIYFDDLEVEKSYNFAREMLGKHNPDMIMERSDWEIFRDDIRGKLGEIAIRNYIKTNIPNAEIQGEIDFGVTPRGEWDLVDLIVNGKYLSIKTIKVKSGFLLIETKRYNKDGSYVYKNNDGEPVRVDYYILVKVHIGPEISEGAFKAKTFDDFINKAWDPVARKEVRRIFYADILGGVSHTEFWKEKTLAPQGIRCTRRNLLAISQGKDIKALPDKITGNEKKTERLQQDNFILDGYKQLHWLKEFI